MAQGGDDDDDDDDDDCDNDAIWLRMGTTGSHSASIRPAPSAPTEDDMVETRLADVEQRMAVRPSDRPTVRPTPRPPDRPTVRPTARTIYIKTSPPHNSR